MNSLIFLQIIFELIPVSSSNQVALGELLLKLRPLTLYETFFAHIPTLLFLLPFFYFSYRTWIKKQSWRTLLWQGTTITIISGGGVLGMLLKKILASYGYAIPFWYGSLLTSLVLFFVNFFLNHAKNEEQVSLAESVIIASIQGIAAIGGISRFATVLFSTLLFGASPFYALFVALASGIVTMGGAAGIFCIQMFIKKESLLLLQRLDIFFLVMSLAISLMLFYGFIAAYEKKNITSLSIYAACTGIVGLWIILHN